MECIIRDDAYLSSDMVTALQKRNICRTETIYLAERAIVSEEKIIQGKGNIKQELYPDPGQPAVRASLKRYWRKNIIFTIVLLAFWAAAGLGCGVLLADRLNLYKLPGTGFPTRAASLYLSC